MLKNGGGPAGRGDHAERPGCVRRRSRRFLPSHKPFRRRPGQMKRSCRNIFEVPSVRDISMLSLVFWMV